MRLARLLAFALMSVSGALLIASCEQPSTLEGEDGHAATTLKDGAIGEAADDLKLVTCPDNDPVECMIRCGIAGIPCTPRIRHPYHPDRGDGGLVRCAELVRQFCTYRFDDGEECAVFRGAPFIPCTPPR